MTLRWHRARHRSALASRCSWLPSRAELYSTRPRGSTLDDGHPEGLGRSSQGEAPSGEAPLTRLGRSSQRIVGRQLPNSEPQARWWQHERQAGCQCKEGIACHHPGRLPVSQAHSLPEPSPWRRSDSPLGSQLKCVGVRGTQGAHPMCKQLARREELTAPMPKDLSALLPTQLTYATLSSGGGSRTPPQPARCWAGSGLVST